MFEYRDDPEATAELKRGGWHHTGDLNAICNKDDLQQNRAVSVQELATDSGPVSWKTVFAAGQDIGTIDNLLSVAKLVKRLRSEYGGAYNHPRTYP